MALDESDLELLDGYLDDALDERGREAVRARLAGEQDWIAALEQLRGERAMRQALFAGLEPSQEAVERLVGRVRDGIERRRGVERVLRAARYVSAAAACFVVGFFVHAMFFAQPLVREHPGAQPVSHNGSTVRAVETYEVTLRDASGKVVAVQRFDSLAKAQEFANDVSQWQRRAERLASGQFVVRAQRL
jgi:hypothetical protein